MKKIKFLLLTVVLIVLTSCGGEEKDNNIEAISSQENISTEKKVVNISEKVAVDKTDDEIIDDMKKSIARNIPGAETTDIEIINKELKKCEGEENADICRNIVIEIEAEKQKNIDFCEKHSKNEDISRCKSKVAMKLVTREMNPIYCEKLGEFEKEQCQREYEDSVKRELDIQKNFEDNVEKIIQ